MDGPRKPTLPGSSVIAPPTAPINLAAEQDPHRTCLSRVLFSQEVRVVLEPADFVRQVQVIVPAGPVVYLDEDRPVAVNPDGTAPPGLVGRNRVYKLPALAPDQQIEFPLAAGQWLIGAVKEGKAEVTFIVVPKSLE